MPSPKPFKNQKSVFNYSFERLSTVLSLFTPNRIKILCILPERKEDAIRFKFLKNYSKIDPKNLQKTLKFLLEKKVITTATEWYKSGYKDNGEEKWIETHPYYYITDFGHLVREMLEQMAQIQDLYMDDDSMSIKTERTGIYSITEYFTSNYCTELMKVPGKMAKLMDEIVEEI